ncbi:MAG: hydrogenase nickel incorporation protein HypB [Phycisphaerae bacterium]|nr:hydrogenase nickel incorporation protein HypB [Phycisphaerae bacterium]
MAVTTVKVLTDVLKATKEEAGRLRADFAKSGTFVLDLIGGPGCGKTRLLEASLPLLTRRFRTAVLVGDVATARDAERLAGRGAESYQLVTEGACHLSPSLVRVGVSELVKTIGSLPELLIIENVGNLVCPASFDIGEDVKVAMSAVTEGPEKPEKYPALFRKSAAVILNKMDLAELLEFDREYYWRHVQRINGEALRFELSAKTAAGLDAWIEWIARQVEAKRGGGEITDEHR